MKIIIVGIGGHLGKAIYQTAKDAKIEVVAGIDVLADNLDFPIPVYKSLTECKEKADALIDFSRPTSLAEILDYIVKTNTPAVLATTGYTKEQQEAVEKTAEKVAIFQTSNMSLGVNLLINLAKQAAEFLGTSYDIEIIEQHHNRKVDAPSGTALSIASAINGVFDNTLVNTYGRTPSSGKRDSKEIGIHAVRGGNIVGKHDVLFIGSEEILTITHTAQSRSVFAIGAVRAAEFIAGKGPGMYNMNDLIGQDYSVTTVGGRENIALVCLDASSFAEVTTLFKALSSAKVNVDMISQAPSDKGLSVSFSISSEDVDKVKKIANCTVRENLAQLVIIGAGMEHQSGVADSILSTLSEAGIEICAITTSATEISCVLDAQNLQKAVELLRSQFGIRI